ncbi:hypothetical protein [Thermofilum pendens]|uniref:Glycosyltransferase RgtA/B/C/D-like domain-containing protein n=1 Tax=Thermofilum pendens (strain DSM 2475 / Hrk 5) TaxID=368408 RepID=A1S0Z3_THEPD|nr:hypothetical protein [Thermofilum pendens]ABL79123.1 hypothetical protein Tpen_1728 [Thermofilum pendens Hrk 5]
MSRRNAVLSALIPALVRTIPEILSWPYTVGFDPVGIYAVNAYQGVFLSMGIPQLFKTTSLYFLIVTLAYKALGDPILAVKLLAPILNGLLGYTVYRYARSTGLGEKASLAAALISTTYFVGLRISWEMHRQMLATAMLLAYMELDKKPGRAAAAAQAALAFLIGWTHEFITVILAAVAAARLLSSKTPREALRAFTALPAGALLLYQVYTPETGALAVPAERLAGVDPAYMLAYATGFLAYLYAPLLPLLAYGASTLRDRGTLAWTATCLAMTYSFLTGTTVLWFRWAILLNYPASLAAGAGLEKLLEKPGRARKAALALVAVYASMTATYIALPPEQQFNKYFGDWNIYKHYMQTSMLQNTLPLSDTPSAIQAVKWVDTLPGNKTLVLHEAFHSWAALYAKNSKLIRVGEHMLSAPNQYRPNTAEEILRAARREAATGAKVYTIWWVAGKGWYNMPNPPPGFKEVKRFGEIAVYEYQG